MTGNHISSSGCGPDWIRVGILPFRDVWVRLVSICGTNFKNMLTILVVLDQLCSILWTSGFLC